MSTYDSKIKKLEERISQLEKAVFGTKQFLASNKKEQENLNNGILTLVKNGFFEKPRKYKDIIKELKTNAIFSKNIKYGLMLTLLVREKRLRRKMIDHQWVYSDHE